MATTACKVAHGVPQQHAQTLRDQEESNIDDLLTIVTESVGAYKVRQERIDAVEKALQKALNDTGAVPKEAARGAKTPTPTDSADDPDDIPFEQTARLTARGYPAAGPAVTVEGRLPSHNSFVSNSRTCHPHQGVKYAQ